MPNKVIKLHKANWTYDPKRPFKEGGFGKVFLGESAQGAKAIIKRLEGSRDQKSREIAVVAQLMGNDRPNVIPILDYGLAQPSGAFFVVMPLADTDLEAEILLRGPLSSNAAVSILQQIAAGLASVPVVHRDLKPKNILLHEGVWKIADFGLSKFANSVTSANTVREYRTAAYAAPEQWLRGKTSAATDVYALRNVSTRVRHRG